MEQAARCDEHEDAKYKERTGYEPSEDLAFKQGRLKKIQAAKAALEEKERRAHPGETIADSRQISFADHDANIMGKRGAHFEYAYNAQISVDSIHQLIVGQGITDHANDYAEAKPSLAQIQSSCEQLPETMSLDNGYYSGENLEALSDEGVEAFIATNRDEQAHGESIEDSTRALIKSDFSYTEDKDEYTCPMGKTLKRVGKASAQAKRLRYSASASDGQACPLRSRCFKGSKARSRTIENDDKEHLRREMNRRMSGDRGRAIYDRRKVIVEPVFGQIKNSGFRGLSVRGKSAVEGEFALVCLVHNLRKIGKAILGGSIRLEARQWVVF